MKTTFETRGATYHADIRRIGKPEGESFEVYEVTVHGPQGEATQGTLKLTREAVELAKRMAASGGGSAEEWVARGGARSLAAELYIRKLKPSFAFVVDHRWIAGVTP